MVGRKTIRATSGSASVVGSVAVALALSIVGRALGLVGRKTSHGVAGTASVILVLAGAGGRSTGSCRGGRGGSRDRGRSGVRNEAGDDTARSSNRVLTEASGVLANAGGLVGGKTIDRSSLASGQGCIAVALALSILSRALGLVGRKTGDGVASTASIVLGNTASGSSSRVLGSDSANEGERGNSSELHVCDSGD